MTIQVKSFLSIFSGGGNGVRSEMRVTLTTNTAGLNSRTVGTWTPQPIKQDSSYQLFVSTDTTRLKRWL